MKYLPLGDSGLSASVIGFGAWAIGGGAVWGGESDDAESIKTITAALDAGINLLDTAPAYGWGHSERLIAKAIEGRRDEVLIAPFNDAETAADLIRTHRQELAAVIVEPFQRLIPPAPGFLETLRAVTAEHGIALIFDEIVTGFRFAYGGAQEYYGVVPDLCALGKVIGGGFPLAAIAGGEAYMAHFDKAAVAAEDFLPMTGTLSGNPVAAAAGLATLEILRRPGTYERLFATGRDLMAGLSEALARAGLTAKVVGEPPLFDVFFTGAEVRDYRSAAAADKAKLLRFNRLLLERGVLKGESKFYVSLAHDAEDVAQSLATFTAAAEALQAAA